MARGKRRAPVTPAVVVPENMLNDEVDSFIAQRHNFDKDHESDSDAPVSDDISSEDQASSDEDHSEDEDDAQELDDKRGWGGKKSLYYGGDTHEYEIMEEEERKEALKDEEEEARRLQKEAVQNLHPADYHDEDGEDTDAHEISASEEEGTDTTLGQSAVLTVPSVEHSAPEIPVLIHEMLESRRQAIIWKGRVHWNEVAKILFHLYASLVTNIAFYLAMRTDPDSEGVDIRTHPVLVQIVRIRALLKDARALPCDEPVKSTKNTETPRFESTVKRPSIKVKGTVDEVPSVKGHSPIENGVVNGAVSNGVVKHHDKGKKRKKSNIRRDSTDLMLQEDEKRVRTLLPSRATKGEERESGDESRQEEKRRKLGALVGAMERERKNSVVQRLMSVDADVVRAEPRVTNINNLPVRQDGLDELDMDSIRDDEGVMQKMLANKEKKEARKARKAADAKPHVYTFKDAVRPEARRRASSQVVKNRGLTRYRPKDKKTPRSKNRLAYSKAIVRRKGAVQDFTGKPGSSYSGEASGINMSTRKGSRLSNV